MQSKYVFTTIKQNKSMQYMGRFLQKNLCMLTNYKLSYKIETSNKLKTLFIVYVPILTIASINAVILTWNMTKSELY